MLLLHYITFKGYKMYLKYTAPTNHHFYNYLINQRGITPQEIRDYQIGFAGDFLQERNKLRDYKGNQIIAFRKDKKGNNAPIFSNRVMFPIFNMDNKIIAWSGRSLDPEQPKYFNSPDSRMFNKSQSFFGLNVFLKRKNRKKVIITEGQLDTIKANRYAPSLAPMGKFTKTHAKVLRDLGVKEALVVGDNDKAGRDFTRQAIKHCLEFDILPKVGKLKKEFNDFGETNNQKFNDIVEVQDLYTYLKTIIDFIRKDIDKEAKTLEFDSTEKRRDIYSKSVSKYFIYKEQYDNFIMEFPTLEFLSIQEAINLYIDNKSFSQKLVSTITNKYDELLLLMLDKDFGELTNIENLTLDRLGFTVHRLTPIIYEDENIIRYYDPKANKEIDLSKEENDRLKKIAKFLSPS